MSEQKSVVIGSGIAGIAAAIRLANAGHQVKLLEVNSHPGGKISEIKSKGYRFDAGPSVFTLPEFVDELFRISGKDPRDYFSYRRKEVTCRYFWEDGTELTAWADVQAFAREAAEKTGVDEEAVIHYLQKSQETYEAASSVFLEKSLHKLENYFNKDLLNALANIRGLNLMSTLNQVNKNQLKTPKMVQLFNRFATYNGSSPFLTPGVMRIIPHLEHNLGSYYPVGGMYRIITALVELARELGVEFHFNERAEQILVEDAKVTGVKSSGGQYPANFVFSNMDVVGTYQHLLTDHKAPEKVLDQPRSSSAVIFYWGIKKEFPQLDHHNIFFSDNYREEFSCIFEEGEVFDDPTVYVSISAKEEKQDAPKGSENWFVMVNVPPNTGQDWAIILSKLRANVIAKLNRMLSTDIEPLIEFEESLDPRGIESKTSSFQGALYGVSSNTSMAAFLRHPNFSRKIEALYFCGGSVHPGGGIPLCLLSAKIATEMTET